MPAKNHFCVKLCEKRQAKEYILPRHYSGTWNANFGTFCVGLFLDDRMVGCAVFGRFMNQNSYGKLHPLLNKDNCLELNRLFVDDDVGRNIESWFLSRCIAILKTNGVKCVQSFSDGRLGCGIVYQASNFDYYGFHKSVFIIDKSTGMIAHKKVMENSKRQKAMLFWQDVKARGDLQLMEVNTFRYLFWIDKRMRKDCLLKQQPYPKMEKCMTYLEVYNAS